MESLNCLFSAVKRKNGEHQTVKYMIPMLYFVAGKFPIPFC